MVNKVAELPVADLLLVCTSRGCCVEIGWAVTMKLESSSVEAALKCTRPLDVCLVVGIVSSTGVTVCSETVCGRTWRPGILRRVEYKFRFQKARCCRVMLATLIPPSKKRGATWVTSGDNSLADTILIRTFMWLTYSYAIEWAEFTL